MAPDRTAMVAGSFLFLHRDWNPGERARGAVPGGADRRRICGGPARLEVDLGDAVDSWDPRIRGSRVAVVCAGADGDAIVLPDVLPRAQPGTIRDEQISPSGTDLVFHSYTACRGGALDDVCCRRDGGCGARLAIPAEESPGTWRRADAVSPAMDGHPGRVLLVLAVEAAGVHPAGGASCTAAGGGVSAQADGGTDESELSAAGGACFACGDIDCGTADCAGKDA